MPALLFSLRRGIAAWHLVRATLLLRKIGYDDLAAKVETAVLNVADRIEADIARHKGRDHG